MKYVYTGIILIVFTFTGIGGVQQYADAHGGQSHIEGDDETVLTLSQMEDLISKLRQIIRIMSTRINADQLAREANRYTPIVPEVHTDAEMGDHHDEMATDAENVKTEEDEHAGHTSPVATAQKLVIEIEAHYDRTHVHVRYTDKPEAMFFVDVALANTEAIAEAIHKHTGLSLEEVTAALVRL